MSLSHTSHVSHLTAHTAHTQVSQPHGCAAHTAGLRACESVAPWGQLRHSRHHTGVRTAPPGPPGPRRQTIRSEQNAELVKQSSESAVPFRPKSSNATTSQATCLSLSCVHRVPVCSLCHGFTFHASAQSIHGLWQCAMWRTDIPLPSLMPTPRPYAPAHHWPTLPLWRSCRMAARLNSSAPPPRTGWRTPGCWRQQGST